ncbi:hypothetical protein RHGRI_016676 [Rhododendron griersonianum]|uniref:Uncharacterized protein n=1 Tax=Rhododendron griersonianum TaxID=479676 RepID=A0AAV6JV06_9ERIC|nr:hypothetical protein RHGRI_016676 [Rhododendron griersonianum]KAG5544001.1 hypothetical protein RHGRI_016676 [Rhododendron griersonianum]
MASETLQIESIPIVDLRFLSQSDLHALSHCTTASSSSFDPRRSDDLVIPQIDRSVFNESAGSRKQTYSRLRLAPRKPLSSSSSLPRRTPAADDVDPERTENHQIIGLLKQLFAPKPSGDDLVPIRVEYGESAPEFPNAGRGLVAEGNRAVVGVEGGNAVVNDIVVFKEVVEDRDKEILKEDVNLEALASVEDPYDVELLRRTKNLKTEEEVLGYLGEINGKWGTWRRKKKIVEASEFGDALPKGWKLLVSIRKKQGRVWLFVSRYMSPNGQQFMSWKEVSPYLLSFFGLPNANHTNFGQSKENIQLNCKMAIENAADLAFKERNKGGELVSNSPSVITYLTNHDDKQLSSEVGNSDQMGAILKCKKCTMTFTEKDDLLHHQLSSHRRRRSRLGTSVTDGVIIKGGQYECQFCHKTFDERHRYNGHVGAHIRHHMKSDEASPGVLSMQNNVDPVTVPSKESMIQTSVDDDDDAMTLSAETDIALTPASQSRCQAGSDIESCTEVKVLSGDEQDTQSNFCKGNSGEECRVQDNIDNKMNNCVGSVDQANGIVAAKFGSCLNSEIAKSDNENNIIGECAANGSKDSPIQQERILESRPCSPFASEKTCDAEINVNGEPIMVEETNKEASSERVSLAPNHNEKACCIGNMEDVDKTSPMGGPEPDTTYFDSKLSGYEQTWGVKSDACNINANKLEEPKLDEVQTYENNGIGLGTHHRRVNTQEISLEFGSVILSGNEKTFVEENVNENCNITELLPKQKGSFSDGFLIQSCTGKNFGDFYTTSTIEEPKPDEVQNSSNSGLILAFGNNSTGIVADGMDNGPIVQTFRFENDLRIENSRIGKDPKEESSLFGSSYYSRMGADENNMDRVSTGRVWEGPMINEVGNSGSDNLMIGFGSTNSQSVGDVIPGYMWRNDEGNILQSTLADTSTQMEQSSGCYPTFTLFSDKGENELLEVNGKYDSMLGFEGAQSGHIEPVEFSFLTTQNLSSLQGDSKAMSYNTEVGPGPGFDSSFWLEKDALSLNTAANNLVTAVCIWCTNEFHHDPAQAGTQTGAIGTVCPNCSAKVSQQFNFF